MSRPKEPSALTPESLLAPFPARIRSLANRLRGILQQAVPAFTQRALPGWRAISFREPSAGHVCAVFPFDDHVKLYLEFGALLPDPHGLLQGSTRQTRFIRFETARDIRRRPLVQLVRHAVVMQTLRRTGAA